MQLSEATAGKRMEMSSQSTGEVPLTKKIACLMCRKRKLRCDGGHPCRTCSRFKISCIYDENRKKSGPKRGYVKALEERLAHVENLLKTKDEWSEDLPQNYNTSVLTPASSVALWTSAYVTPENAESEQASNSLSGFDRCGVSKEETELRRQLESFGFQDRFDLTTSIRNSRLNKANNNTLIALGMNESLPDKLIMDELYGEFFNNFHRLYPFINKYRFLASLNLSYYFQPPIYLRYIMWAIGASSIPKYRELANVYYVRARKYLEVEQISGHGERVSRLAFPQAWALVTYYEYYTMFFPRAWISCGIATRLAYMLQLNVLNSGDFDIPICVVPPSDFSELEERRRTFWFIVCTDRFASLGTGFSMSLQNDTILTNLPASDEAFYANVQEKTYPYNFFMDFDGSGASGLSYFSALAAIMVLIGKTINFSQLSVSKISAMNREGESSFLKKYKALQQELDKFEKNLPPRFRDINLQLEEIPRHYLVTLLYHVTVICLNVELNKSISAYTVNRYKWTKYATRRCLKSSLRISETVRGLKNRPGFKFDPISCFCMYIAARWLVGSLGKCVRPSLKPHISGLLSTLDSAKSHIFFANSFMMQLEADITNIVMGKVSPTVDPTFGSTSQSSNAPCSVNEMNQDRMAGGQGMPEFSNNYGINEDNTTTFSGINSEDAVEQFNVDIENFISTNDESSFPTMANLVSEYASFTSLSQGTSHSNIPLETMQQQIHDFVPYMYINDDNSKHSDTFLPFNQDNDRVMAEQLSSIDDRATVDNNIGSTFQSEGKPSSEESTLKNLYVVQDMSDDIYFQSSAE
ncbi:fungal-specific transcription factor domain-containing protein [Dipodascopsis uninucleata]